jgi:UDP-N-acetylmuramate dehydrogenase
LPEQRAVALADLTTLRVGGPASAIEVTRRSDLVEAVVDAGSASCLVVAGGSNLVVADAGVNGSVILVRTTGVTVSRRDSHVLLDVEAGEPWDALVRRCVAEGWSGIECLAGIPGSTGATPVQNVGAYGQEVAEVIDRVEVFDRRMSDLRSMTADDCGFGYRSSIFRAEPDRFVVLSVRFRLRETNRSAPLKYAELATRLDASVGDVLPLAEVQAAVLELRRGKGMVLDAQDHDTWSAGSFFTNPIVPAELLPEAAPRWPASGGLVKTSAAWLIERAGFARGFGRELGSGRAALSSKHTLAITNRGGASTEDVLLVARTVRDGVRQAFGVSLVPEPTLVGIRL